jgi:nucleoside-diphosphate-sugar epimerase
MFNSKATLELDWMPKHNIKDELENTVAWYVEKFKKPF